MSEFVRTDLVPGFTDVPVETWQHATPENVLRCLYENIPEAQRDESLSLREVLYLQQPAHILVESGYFEPDGGFEVLCGVLSAEVALHCFYNTRHFYLEESLRYGGKAALQDAAKLFEELKQRPHIKELHDKVYPPKPPRLRDRLLGRVAANTRWY